MMKLLLSILSAKIKCSREKEKGNMKDLLLALGARAMFTGRYYWYFYKIGLNKIEHCRNPKYSILSNVQSLNFKLYFFTNDRLNAYTIHRSIISISVPSVHIVCVKNGCPHVFRPQHKNYWADFNEVWFFMSVSSGQIFWRRINLILIGFTMDGGLWKWQFLFLGIFQ